MSRKAVAITILLIWFGALGWLAQRRTVGIHSGVIIRTWPVSPGAAFFGVYRDGHQVGLATLSIDTLVEGLRTDELVTLDLPLQGRSVRRSTLRTEALYSKSLRLLRWETNLLTDEGRSVVQGKLGEDGVITIYNGLGGAVETLTVASPAEPLLLPGAVPFLLANAENRKIGRILTPTVFDPATTEISSARYRVAAESTFVVPDSAEFDSTSSRWVTVHADTTPAWRLDGLEAGLPSRRWVDAHGITLQIDRPIGLVVEQSAFEVVNTNYRADGAVSGWDTSGAVRLSESSTGATSRRTDRMRIGLLGADLSGFAPGVDGGTQQREADTITVVRADTAAGGAQVGDSAALAPWLHGTPLIRSDDPRVRQRAADIVRDAPSAARKARLLGQWVSRAVRLERRPGSQSALRTLARRAGTRNDRLILLVAMLRAQGVPARLAAGLREESGRFYPNGWVEYFDRDWIPIDPENGTVPADASRLRLLIERPARPFDLMLLAGRTELTVLDTAAVQP
ncbi:MAG TPA: transglutaminase family protein [Gemmatimonadales bacterium]|nr:transglutaminase family protein [Gemmatimonadales bacterium]